MPVLPRRAWPGSPARRRRSHSARSSAYSTSPSSSPSIGYGQSAWKVRTRVRPAFSITCREAACTTIVSATTRCTPKSVKPLLISARDPSVAYPLPHADLCSR